MNPQNQNLDDLLSTLSTELCAQKSLAPEILTRLEHEKIDPPRALHFPRLLLATAAIMLLTFALSRFLFPTISQPKPTDPAPASASLQLDNLTITQNLALPLDARTLLVAWSYHLTTTTTLPPFSTTPIPHEHYTELPLRSALTSDGNIYCCSLFIADEKTIPALTPPTILIHLLQNQIISFGASLPQTQSPTPLSNINWGPPSTSPLTSQEIQLTLTSNKFAG